MLRMKKNLVGFAFIASLLVGCQSAPKSTEQVAFSYEGLDVADYGVDRNPAGSIEPIAKAAFDIMRTMKSATVKGIPTNRGAEFLRFVDSSTDESVKAIKDAKNATIDEKNLARARGAKKQSRKSLTEADLESLPVEVQAKLVAQFLDANKMDDLPLSASAAKQVKDQRKFTSKADLSNVKNASSGKLLNDMNAKGVIQDQRMSTGVKNLTAEGITVIQAAIKQMAATDPRFATKEGQELLEGILEESMVIFTYSRQSHLIPETCDNLNYEAALEYYKLLKEIRNELEEYAPVKYVRGKGKKIRGIDCNEKSRVAITAWTVEKFQRGLGRVGDAARTARREMGTCRYIASNVSNYQFPNAATEAQGPKPGCL